MKRINIIKWIGLILFLFYIVLLVVDLSLDVLGDWRILVFSLVLALISTNLIAKGVIIKSSSTLWFSITLVLFAITIAIFELKSIKAFDYYYIFSLIPIISSIINLAIFQNLIYIKVIILNISIIIPVCIQYFFHLRTWIIITTLVGCIVGGIIVCRCINLNKENENGKI